MTTPRWSLSVGPESSPALFDRATDRTQSVDRSEERPAVVSELTDRLAGFVREKGAVPGDVEAFVR